MTAFTDSVDRAALGRCYGLGALYNIYQDKFLDAKVYKTETLAPELIANRKNPNTKYLYLSKETLQDKFSSLNVSAELQVSVMSGMVSVGGSASYLKEKKKSSTSITSTLIYSCNTEVDELNIYHENFKNYVSEDALNFKTSATHMVMKIEWGGGAVATAETTTSNTVDTEKIAAKMDAAFKTIGTSVSVSASTELEKTDKEIGSQCSIHISGDFLFGDDGAPQTFKGANEFMKGIPDKVIAVNGGKGVQVTYTLIPILDVKKVLKFPVDPYATLPLTLLPVDLSAAIVSHFQKSTVTQTKFADLVNFVHTLPNSATKKEAEEVTVTKQLFDVQLLKVVDGLRDILPLIRSEAKDSKLDDLKDLLKTFDNSKYSVPLMEDFLHQRENLISRLTWHSHLFASNIKIVGPYNSLQEIKSKSDLTHLQILYGSETLRQNNEKRWYNGYQYLDAVAFESKDNIIPIYIDIEVNPDTGVNEIALYIGEGIPAQGEYKAKNKAGDIISWTT